MRYPEFLKKNGTIGFVAPSYGCNIEPYKSAFRNAQRRFRKMGYRVELGPNCYEGSGVGISNTPEKCAAELQEYYCSGSNDVLISCGGGELMCEDLNYMDFERIAAAKPKWYLGYSDNTNMTFLLTTLCDTASIYGPCAPAFGMEPWHPAIRATFDVLTGKGLTASDVQTEKTAAASDVQTEKAVTVSAVQTERDTTASAVSAEKILRVHSYDKYEKESLKDEKHPLLPYHVTEPRVMVRVPDQDVRMEGRLIGGCLDLLPMYLGTRFDRVQDFLEKYSGDGILWFLESCDLNPMGIRRALWQLEQAGWFRHVSGFLIGRPLCHGETLLGMDQYEAVTGILGKYGVPILMDLDIGHIPPAMPLICGSYAKVVAVGNDISIEMMLR
ncbi:MAG: LD-carboxypeptidase [Clostridiales bacterium]|nr:LD-carboxypeptidase [Clostridiales bacterium]